MSQSKVLLAEPTQKIVLLTIPGITEVMYFEKVERYKSWWTIETILINLKKSYICTYFWQLFLLDNKPHSETVNEKGVAAEVELKVMYILVRAGILQTWHDVLDLCVYIFISFKKEKLWEGWGGKGGEVGFFKYKMISMQVHLEKQNLV